MSLATHLGRNGDNIPPTLVPFVEDAVAPFDKCLERVRGKGDLTVRAFRSEENQSPAKFKSGRLLRKIASFVHASSPRSNTEQQGNEPCPINEGNRLICINVPFLPAALFERPTAGPS